MVRFGVLMRPFSLTRLRELGYQSYDDYLRSPLWKQNRARCVTYESCFVCGKVGIVHFHHCSYKRLGNERPGDLIVLCGPHHRDVHKFIKEYKVVLADGHIAFKKFFDTGQLPELRKKKLKKRPKSKTPKNQPRRKTQKSKQGALVGKLNEDLHRVQQKNKLNRRSTCACQSSNPKRLRDIRDGICFKCGQIPISI